MQLVVEYLDELRRFPFVSACCCGGDTMTDLDVFAACSDEDEMEVVRGGGAIVVVTRRSTMRLLLSSSPSDSKREQCVGVAGKCFLSMSIL
jgi:hypothetical protein